MNKCLSCGKNNLVKILDLGKQPVSNNFVYKKNITSVKKYDLGLSFCKKCFLVQNTKIIKNTNIFNKNYLYYSSFSKTWLEHSKKLVIECIKKFQINKKSTVMEIASNDGYLLNYFKQRKINCYGIEPSTNVSIIAKKKGIKTYNDFFSKKFLKHNRNLEKPDLIVALNVIAHTPYLNDFVNSLYEIMKKNSVCVMEFPYIKNLIDKKQIDTIYHEHYSYFSLLSLNNLLKKNSLELFDYKFVKTHGGSLRVMIKKKGGFHKKKSKVDKFLKSEMKNKLHLFNYYKKSKK